MPICRGSKRSALLKSSCSYLCTPKLLCRTSSLKLCASSVPTFSQTSATCYSRNASHWWDQKSPAEKNMSGQQLGQMPQRPCLEGPQCRHCGQLLLMYLFQLIKLGIIKCQIERSYNPVRLLIRGQHSLPSQPSSYHEVAKVLDRHRACNGFNYDFSLPRSQTHVPCDLHKKSM